VLANTGNRFGFDGQIWSHFPLSSWLPCHLRNFCPLDYSAFAYVKLVLKIWFIKRGKKMIVTRGRLLRTEDKLLLSN